MSFFVSLQIQIYHFFPNVLTSLAVLALANDYWVKMFLGALIVGYSFYSLQKKNGRRLASDSRLWLFICGFLSGILGGASGINGPPLVVYGDMRQWTATQFRTILQAYFLPVSLISILGYGIQGLLT
jgi:uncharacterized membrane protein YfcA